ncbi:MULTISPECIES: ribbon-helix-helix domain-containing protein [Pseudanabaena]|uniref:CopG-like domain-containing protein DNA-binding n=2 Tax=Pseudanabaena TaxID=1152 RepID=L8N847_9CYAN|nr:MULTISPECIES: CopG family transcriptional regulator [Pseudanabaena]ELS34820.1 CopG-like domain-containing protein DNA-binding [Pseudanabaena biceps PCC 7429]MDG3492943.1 hypothetical protein [Pseudanabaena catenata USMAC16]
MASTVENKPVSKRINVTLPDKTGALIEKLASVEGRSVSSMAAYLIQKAVDDAREKGLIKDEEKG